MIYAAVGSDGKVHIYGLNLSNIAAVPVPTQLTTLSLNDTATGICSQSQAQTDLADPTTVFLLLETSGVNGSCGSQTVADLFYVIRYTDSATAAPMGVNINSTDISPLYTSGKLSGLVLFDAPTSRLLYWPNSSFTPGSQTVLVTGATAASEMYDSSNNLSQGLGTTFAFFDVTVGSVEHLYRVTAAGAATSVYTAAGTLGGNSAADNTNLYFTDFISGTSLAFYQEALSGSGTTTQLLSTAPPASSTTNIIGSNGSKLVYNQDVVSNSGSTSTLYSVPVGQTSATASTIGSSAGFATAFMAGSNQNDPSTDKLFVNVSSTDSTVFPAVTSQSTLVYSVSGTVLQPALAGSAFQFANAVLLNTVVQFKGITATDGSYSGASPYRVNVSDLSSAAFANTTSGGSPYVVPTSQSAFFFALSNSTGEVNLFLGTGSAAAAYDLSQLIVVPITIANTNVFAL